MPRSNAAPVAMLRIPLTAVAVLAAVVVAACTSSTGQSSTPGSSGTPSSATPSSATPSSATAATLEGPFWELTGYVGADGKTVSATGATATFAEGKVAGNSGCNEYTAGYTVDGDKLTLGQIATTMKACPPPETALEKAYLAALGKVATWSITGDVLELKTSEGKVGLTYVASKPASLAGTPWFATGVNNGKGGVQSIATGTSISAIFAVDGTVAGSGGCNTYNGPYTADGATIKIGPLASTKKLCGEPAGVDDQEAAYFAALGRATKFTIKGDTLELRDDAGALQVSYRQAIGAS